MNNDGKHIGAGITFYEVSPGDMLHLDATSPYHLIFLLKGNLEIKSLDGSTVYIAENEFFVMNSRQADCVIAGPSRLVVVDWAEDLPRAYPIDHALSVWLHYQMATMPFNEKLEHHSIQRAIRVMMRKYDINHHPD